MGRLRIGPGPLVYLAGPITYDLEGSKIWRRRAEACLKEAGVAAFNPHGGFTLPDNELSTPAFLSPVQTINDVAIMMSSCVLVHVARHIPSAGTEHEMRLCKELGKPVVLWVPWLPYVQTYDYDSGWCDYIDVVRDEYGSDFRVVFVARSIEAACGEAASHASVPGLTDVAV